MDSFIVPAKNLKVGKRSGRRTITKMRSELEEDNGEDEEHNYDAIEEQEAEHESESDNQSESELEVDRPPL